MKIRPSFYKILMDLTLSLGFPEDFTEKYGEILPKTAKLRNSAGGTWKVKVEKLEEKCYFLTSGWPKFCKDMGLQLFELLVFSYEGDSTFNVTVYATTALEKESKSRVAGIPRFRVLMRDHHRKRLYVPRKFAEACGLIGKRKVRLEYRDRGGQSAEVGFYEWRGRFSFVAGWSAFWRANGLALDKTYSFDFIPSTNVIKVYPIHFSHTNNVIKLHCKGEL